MTSAPETVITAHHDPFLVALSVLISVVAAYAARELIDRVRAAPGRAWLAWLAGGAVVDGTGTWSMHYTGKLALRLPVPVLFDWPTVLLSLLVSIVGSGAAILVLSRGKVGWLRAVVASIFLGGVGISGMHYTAMAAMRLPGGHHYSSAPATLSVALAVVISLLAIALGFLLRDDAPKRRLRIHAGVWLRGAANPAMHYTAMAAVTFTLSGATPDLSHAVDSSSLGIAGISVIPETVLIVAILTSVMDRIKKQRSLLHELFEQSPQPVVLMSTEGRVVRVNREFTRVFGYTPQETTGRQLAELIVPDEQLDEYQKHLDLVRRGERFEAEGVRRRKDGGRLSVAFVGVPVSLPGGEAVVYAIYRDITERKRAAEARERLRQRLASVEEEERRRIARELHDQMGGDLTALSLLLKSLETAAPQATPAHESARQAQSVVESLNAELRHIVWELRPPALDRSPLDVALEEYLEGWARYYGLEAHFESERFDDGRHLPPLVETTVYRIVQESLTNVRKHAKARRVRVGLELESEPGRVRVVVEDDGVGFDAAVEADSALKFGLAGIRERVELLDGTCDIRSSPGAGTTVTAVIPVPAARREEAPVE